MKSLTFAIAAIALTAAAGAASAETKLSGGQLITGGYDAGQDSVRLERAQYAWGGRNYCWYNRGWHGPGYYFCGMAFRRGHGWGGPEGWHHWSHWRHERHHFDRHRHYR